VAGAGDLVATVAGAEARSTGAEAEQSVPLLADRARAAGVDAPVLRGLANVVEGTVTPERWTAALTAAAREKVRAA
jgi:hypothetical protein